jgi:para-nitrobenzyl esterase
MDRGEVRGAEHGYELPHVFDSWSRIPGAALVLRDRDRAMTAIMHQCWVAFARASVPECDGAPAWPAYSRETDALMEIADAPTVQHRFRRAQLDAWEAAMDASVARQRESVGMLLDGLD